MSDWLARRKLTRELAAMQAESSARRLRFGAAPLPLVRRAAKLTTWQRLRKTVSNLFDKFN